MPRASHPQDRHGNKRTSIKKRSRGSSRTASYRKRRAAARLAQRVRPRTAIKTAVGSSPNTHNFKRSYSHPFKLGTADPGNGVYMNTDNTYMWCTLHTKFNKLPDSTEFKALFNQYKIFSVTHRFVPYLSENMSATSTTATGTTTQVPNFEMFIIPAGFNQRKHLFAAMNGTAIEKWLNCTQRKSQRLVPSNTIRFTSKSPKVVETKGPLDKDGGTAVMTMGSPSYLSTDATALVAGGVDQTDVTHYTTQVLIRRVDGTNMSGAYRSMGYRVETDVYFKCRQVQ